jgi:hypothetical protein
MSTINQAAPSISDSPDSATLTNVQPIQWDDGVPIVDVVTVFANATSPSHILFQQLHVCAIRMKGRAMGRIKNLSVEIMSDPEYAIKAVVGVVPTSAGTGNAPSTTADLIACGGALLKETPYVNSGSKQLTFLPGVSSIIKGETVTLLSGSPPSLYFMAKAVKMEDWTAPTYNAATASTRASGTLVYFKLSYTLELSGYDWVKPF